MVLTLTIANLVIHQVPYLITSAALCPAAGATSARRTHIAARGRFARAIRVSFLRLLRTHVPRRLVALGPIDQHGSTILILMCAAVRTPEHATYSWPGHPTSQCAQNAQRLHIALHSSHAHRMSVSTPRAVATCPVKARVRSRARNMSLS